MNRKQLPDREYLDRRLTQAMAGLRDLTAPQAAAMKEQNTERWICTMLSLCGCTLTRREMMQLLAGDTLLNATLEDMRLVQALGILRREFDSLADLQIHPDLTVIRRFHQILSGEAGPPPYRKQRLRLEEIRYEPPAPEDIPAQMEALEKEIGASLSGKGDVIDYAVRNHDRFMSIMPYGEFSGPTAFAVMSYQLLQAGLPLPAPDITPKEHLRLTAEFVHAGTSTGMQSLLLICFIRECRIPRQPDDSFGRGSNRNDIPFAGEDSSFNI